MGLIEYKISNYFYNPLFFKRKISFISQKSDISPIYS